MKRYYVVFLVVHLFVYLLCHAELNDAKEIHLRTLKYTSQTEKKALVWQKNLRKKLFTLLKMNDLISDKASIPFNLKEISSYRKDKYFVKELEINTTINRRIQILLTIPQNFQSPFPAVVCLGGHGSNLYSHYGTSTTPKNTSQENRDKKYKEFGTVLASRGYVTISTTVSQHQVYEKGRLLMGERLWDCMRCIDYLVSMPEVDSQRIGCAGLSLGGEMAMWLGAMDKRVGAVVSAGFLTYMDQMEENHCMCWKFEGLRELVDFCDIYSLIAPQPLQCQNGLKEPPSQFFVPLARKAMEEIRMIYRDMNKPENVVLDVHEGGHEIDLPALICFFEKHLYQNRWINDITP